MAQQDTAQQQATGQTQNVSSQNTQSVAQQHAAQTPQPQTQTPQQPTQQPAQAGQQTVSVGGAEGAGQVEVQQSAEVQSTELSPQIQQVVQSAQQKQQQARQAKAQGDFQTAVAKSEEILQEMSSLDKNQNTTSPQSQPPTQPQASQQSQVQPLAPQPTAPVVQQEATPQSQPLQSSSEQTPGSINEDPTVNSGQPPVPQNTQQSPPQPSPTGPITHEQPTAPSSGQSKPNEPAQPTEETMSDTDRKAAELLKGVETKYGHLTLDKPSSDGTIRATTDPQSVPKTSPTKPEDHSASHDGFNNVKVVSEPTGTIDISHKQQEEQKGAFHRKLTQAPEPKQPKPTEKPTEKLIDPTEPVESGQKAAVSLLEAIVKRLESEEEKNLDKLTVSDSEEASYRFMEEGVLRAVTNRIKSGEWEDTTHLDTIATKLGYFAAIDVLRDLKKQALDDRSQQTIQQAIDFLMNEHDQIEISEAQETMQAQAG